MPTTPQGKAIASRNATTHGLFARDVVLPSLGEDPEGYRQLADEFTHQLQPRNLLERHYVEKIAAASWRLRRLHRWQAQLFEDPSLTEDERLDKLDKVLRHETALHRQIDTSVKMLNKDVPQLYKSRARDRALMDTMQTERECREIADYELEVEFEAREQLKRMEEATASPTLDYARLDTAQKGMKNCQNEPASLSSSPNPVSPSQPTPPVSGGVASLGRAGVGSSDEHPAKWAARVIAEHHPSSPSLTGRGGEERAGVGSSPSCEERAGVSSE